MLFLKAQVSFLSNFASIFNVIKHNSSVLFFSSNNILYDALIKKIPLKCKFLRLSGAWVNIHQIPCVNFEKTTQVLLNFWIILHCHDTFSTLEKRIPSKSQFWDFQVLRWKFTIFIMSFSKPQVSFSSNFASLFSAIKDNSSILF